MKSNNKEIWEADLESCRVMLKNQAPTETVLGFLRRQGYRKIESIKALCTLLPMTIGEGKQVVHGSTTWSDRWEADEQLHNQIEKHLRQLSKE